MYQLILIGLKLLSILLLAVFSSAIVTMYAHADTLYIVSYRQNMPTLSGTNPGSPEVTTISSAPTHKKGFSIIAETSINLLDAKVAINQKVLV